MQNVLPAHSHEVRLQSYKPEHKIEVLLKSDLQSCIDFIADLAKQRQCGPGLLLSNGGYQIVELKREAEENIKIAGPETLQYLRNVITQISPAFNFDPANYPTWLKEANTFAESFPIL